VDQDKIRADEGKAKEAVKEFGQKAKKETGTTKEPERRP
jgi:hypothetical protein